MDGQFGRDLLGEVERLARLDRVDQLVTSALHGDLEHGDGSGRETLAVAGGTSLRVEPPMHPDEAWSREALLAQVDALA